MILFGQDLLTTEYPLTEMNYNSRQHQRQNRSFENFVHCSPYGVASSENIVFVVALTTSER